MKFSVFITVLGIYAVNTAWCIPPVITPKMADFLPNQEGKLVVEAGKSFTLECQGKKSVNWTSYPTYDADEASTIDIGSRRNNNFHVFLRVNQTNFRDTGYYYCSTIDAKGIDDVENVQKVYIYVQDIHNIIVYENERLFQTVPQFSTFVIPCRPSSPKVVLSLVVDEERIDTGYEREYGDNLKVSFDPTIGFKLENLNLKDSNTYFCKAAGFEETEERYVIIQVLPFTDTMPTPSINGSAERLFGVEGRRVSLECSVIISSEVIFAINWKVPDPTAIESKKIIIHNTTNVGTVSSGNNPMKQVVRLLTIQNASVNDSGYYKCEVRDHNDNYNAAEKYLHISGSNEKYINMTTDTELITVPSKIPKIQWVIKLATHPPANLSWINPEGKVINAFGQMTGREKIKYEQVKERENEVILRIFNVSLSDAGVYQLKARNKELEKILNLTLIVEESPRVTLEAGQQYYVHDKTWKLKCDVTGHPRPKITWKFSPCDNPPLCKINFKPVDSTPSETVVSQRSSHYQSTLLLKAARSRYISCSAKSELGFVEQIMTFWVSDVGETGSEVKITAPAGVGKEGIIAQDDVTLLCGFSKYNYTNSLVWSFRPDKSSSKGINLKNTYPQVTSYSYKSNLIINNITEDYTGQYICTANDTKGIPASEKISIFVQAQIPPTIEAESMNDTELLVKEGAITKLICNVNGLPYPSIKWLKDDQALTMVKDNITLYHLRDDNTTLEITYSPSNIEGTYTCVVSNRAGTAKRSILIKIENRPSSTSKLVLGAFLILVLISICVIAFLVIKIRKEKKLREELKAIGLEQFDKGAMDNINPDLPIDDQAELLPYDRKWEFPREKLKLGKQLGAGAFGVVMKAEAIGISEGEAISMVAVKMVKRNADHTYIKALASELKIMVHLGKHLNVVNLLGACTKNLNKRELLVIVEYCRFGNLHNYLLRHRADFIDQVDQMTGIIDPNFGADIIARHDSMVMKSRMKYAGLSFSRSRSDSESSGCSPSNSGTINSDAALISMTPTGGEEGCMLSNNSVQPEWRSNYRGDYKGHVRPICTRDVLCWAFQVARGMDYLAGRKVMHGDLAARNILLADDNVVKICDFGLAKSMYKTDNYKKKGDGPLPIKWMAVESISDRVFSTQSDVWSYGIVLWEFFSLAKTPYPGMEADEKLYQKLMAGYRMDKPEYATNAIYEVMKNCWLPRPVDRPTFSDLSEILGSMLEENVKMHYMDLNDPYMNMNNIQWTMGQQSDYLAMMTAPTYDNMVAPGAECNEEELHQYVNGGIPSSPLALCPDGGEASGYLCMSPGLKQGAIFSPRAVDKNESFNFSPKPTLSRDESGNPFEMSHLLSNDNNYLTPIKSPMAVNNLNKEPEDGNPQGWDQKPNLMPSFSNPSYQMLGAAIALTSDNYINMPQHKQFDAGETDASGYSNYVPMTKPSDGAFNQMGFTKSKDGEGVVHFPNDLSSVASGIEKQSEENPYVN